MSSFIKASIGRKFFMSLTGLFLITFLCIHLTLNLFLTFDDSGEMFNYVAHFMVTNPVIKIIEPVLGLGFIIHIIMSGWITIENRLARPTRYAGGDKLLSFYIPKKNMFVLGGLVLIFLLIHISNFWWKMKVTHDVSYATIDVGGVATKVKDAYALVTGLFRASIVYSIIYILGAILLGLHLSHGFWSAFQTIGFNNDKWIGRLKFLSGLFAIIFATGFSYIPIYFIIKF